MSEPLTFESLRQTVAELRKSPPVLLMVFHDRADYAHLLRCAYVPPIVVGKLGVSPMMPTAIVDSRLAKKGDPLAVTDRELMRSLLTAHQDETWSP